jgi:apolipoprotein D and lipocalin family protein
MKVLNTSVLFIMLIAGFLVTSCNTQNRQDLPTPTTQANEQIEGYVIVLKDEFVKQSSGRQSARLMAQDLVKAHTQTSPKVNVLSEQGKVAFSTDLSANELKTISQDKRVAFVEYFKGAKKQLLDLIFNPVKTVDFVDLSRYTGKWYELASFPQNFSGDCECTTATYTPGAFNGIIKVFNQCNSVASSGVAKGTAFVLNPKSNSRLLLTLQEPLVPVPGLYWIVDIRESSSDKPYTFAVVSNPFRNSLFILSRKPVLETPAEQAIYQDILSKLKQQKFDLSKLQTTKQAGCGL